MATVLLVIALVSPVAGQTPLDERRVREGVPLETFTFEAGIGCEFDVEVSDLDGKITYVFITVDRHGNYLDRYIYHTVTRYTNVETGASYTRRFDSVENGLIRPDGSARFVFRNDALYLGGEPGPLDPGLYLVDNGRAVTEYDAEGNVVVDVIESGEIIDLCAELT